MDVTNQTLAEIEGKPLHEITKYIEARYHADLRQRLPELLAKAAKVEQVHADHPACPTGLHSVLNDFYNEMLMHMMKEENVLFPMINQGRGSLAFMPIKMMTSEHDSHAKQLEELHRLTKDFTPPEGACGTWCSLYSGLDKFEQELKEHIHLENNVLFANALTQKEE